MKEISKIGGFGLFFHQHLSYFTIPTLSKLLEKNNFVISDYYEGRPNLFIKAKKISRKIKIKKKFTIKSNNLKNSLKIKKKILNIFNDKKNKKIILFGASALCTTIINFLNATQRKKIILVSDNDKEKFNKILCGSKFTIKSPNLIEKLKFDVLLICSYFFIEEIVKSILEKGVRREKIKKLI
jgi:FlaA1/EpsC-like NDP-sugar epimerase